MCPPSQEAWELTAPICGRTHSTTSTRTKEPWEELVIYCLATKQSKVTVQHRPGSMGLVVEETDDTPHPSPLLGLQQRSRGRSEQPGPRDCDKVCRYPGGRTHRAGQVVSKMQPPGGSGGGQPTKVQSKTTLRPRAAAPVIRLRSLVQVQPRASFQVELRNRDRAGPWGMDAAAPQETDTGMTPAPPKGMSGSASVTPHRVVGPPEGWRLPDRVNLTPK